MNIHEIEEEHRLTTRESRMKERDLLLKLRVALREAMFMHPGARITERVVKVDESAGSDYEIDWSDKFKEMAKLADVDLSKYDPCVYLR